MFVIYRKFTVEHSVHLYTVASLTSRIRSSTAQPTSSKKWFDVITALISIWFLNAIFIFPNKSLSPRHCILFHVYITYSNVFYYVQIGHGRIKNSGFLQLEQNDPSIASWCSVTCFRMAYICPICKSAKLTMHDAYTANAPPVE